VPNCKSFLVTKAERKRVRRRARFQQVCFLQGKAPKEIYAILTETLGEHAPSYATVKNWVAQFKRGIHELILDDRRPDFG
jgi:transposase